MILAMNYSLLGNRIFLRRTPSVALVTTLALLLGSCASDRKQTPDRNHFPGAETAYRQLQEYGGDRDLTTAATSESHSTEYQHARVKIVGEDILLPEAESDGSAPERRYNFWVIAYDDDHRTPIKELLRERVFSIDVVGADSTIDFPGEDEVANALPDHKVAPPEKSSLQVAEDSSVDRKSSLFSAHVAKITVTAKNGSDPLRPFSIVAWFPDKFQNENRADQNRWGVKRDVRVFYGDIRTRVQIVSDRESEAMFGKQFAQHFFVGRVFLRNRSNSKGLAVYTTSMRVPVRFSRKSSFRFELTPGALAALRAEALEVFDGLGKLNAYDKAKERAEALVRDRRPVFTREDDNKAPYIDQVNAIIPRYLEIWALRTDRKEEEVASKQRLNSDERNGLLKLAFDRDIMLAELPARTQLAPEAFQAFTSYDKRRAAEQLVAAVFDTRKRIYIKATNDVNALKEQRNRALESLKKLLSAEQAALYGSITQEIERKDRSQPRQNDPDLKNRVAQVRSDSDRKSFQQIMAELDYLDREEPAAKNVADAMLKTPKNGDPLLQLPEVRRAIAEVEIHASSAAEVRDTPLDEQQFITVNPDDKKLLYSRNPLLQREMLERGYLWKDYYRPMTFQAVLNSVIFAQEHDPKTRGIRYLEALANVAGGAVGLGGTVKEFSSTGYLQSVNIFSSVMVPTLRSLIEDDLKKYIRNLGDMAMDTVVIIPPNDSYDRYVFFPKDAIYNFPDEFDAESPAYIKGIDGDELFVEAVPVSEGTVVRGGAVESGALVTSALNEGELTQQARLLQQAQTQSRLRNVELANLTSRIDAIMAAAGDNEDARRKAQGEVQRLRASFENYFGADQSGAIAATLAKNKIGSFITPPSVFPLRPIELLPGADSPIIQLNIQSPDTPISKLKISTPDTFAWLDSFKRIDDSYRALFLVRTKSSFTGITPAVEVPGRLALPIGIADDQGNTIQAELSILVPEWKATATSTDDSGPVADAKSAKAVPIDFGQKTFTSATPSVVFTVPIHDSDPDKLELKLNDKPAIVRSSKQEVDAARKELRFTVRLDLSVDKAKKALEVSLIEKHESGTPTEIKLATLTVEGKK